jgi:hypothetical protein
LNQVITGETVASPVVIYNREIFMQSHPIPFRLPNADLASYIIPVLDKDFDPFDSEISDINVSDGEEENTDSSSRFSITSFNERTL